MRYASIGGQAVIEGIMMREGEDYSVAVRKPDQTIEVKKEKFYGLNKKLHTGKIPIVRGVFAFVDSLYLGMTTLTYSASFYEEDETQSPLVDTEKNEKKESLMMGATVVFSIVLAVVLFMLTPFFITSLFGKFIQSQTLLAVIEGIIRILIFLIYILAISQMEDIQRTFMYHGAEHKTISCIEAGMELTPENAMKCSRLHKRCGTSFLFLVVFISIIFFMFIRVDTLALKIAYRLILVPVIAGVSFEILQWAGRHDNKLVDIVSAPGLCIQKVTTQEPDESMLEVAIAAIEAIYDWRAFQEEVKNSGDDNE